MAQNCLIFLTVIGGDAPFPFYGSSPLTGMRG